MLDSNITHFLKKELDDREDAIILVDAVALMM